MITQVKLNEQQFLELVEKRREDYVYRQTKKSIDTFNPFISGEKELWFRFTDEGVDVSKTSLEGVEVIEFNSLIEPKVEEVESKVEEVESKVEEVEPNKKESVKKLEEVKVVNVIATRVRGGETIRCRAKVYSTGMVDTDVSDIPTVSTSTPAVLNLQNAEMLIKASVGNMEAKLIILP